MPLLAPQGPCRPARQGRWPLGPHRRACSRAGQSLCLLEAPYTECTMGALPCDGALPRGPYFCVLQRQRWMGARAPAAASHPRWRCGAPRPAARARAPGAAVSNGGAGLGPATVHLRAPGERAQLPLNNFSSPLTIAAHISRGLCYAPVAARREQVPGRQRRMGTTRLHGLRWRGPALSRAAPPAGRPGPVQRTAPVTLALSPLAAMPNGVPQPSGAQGGRRRPTTTA